MIYRFLYFALNIVIFKIKQGSKKYKVINTIIVFTFLFSAAFRKIT